MRGRTVTTRRQMLVAMAASIAAVPGAAHAGQRARPAKHVEEWIAAHARPRVPGSVIGDATIVGLGESSHGAREQIELKHRVLRMLVEEHGFRSVAWEEDWTVGRRINDYILTGEGGLDAVMGEMSTAWRSEEVRSVLRWLRAFNVGRSDKVRFVGVEFFATGSLAYDAVEAYVAEAAPARLPELQRHLTPIRPRVPIGEHLGWYLGVEDKRPYIRHARAVHDLVREVPHAGGDREHALALQHARQIVAFYEHFAIEDASRQLSYRDARSARNLRWWKRYTADKVVYWAATAHTADGPGLRVSWPPNDDVRFGNAGSYLRRWYGRRYRSIGFTFDHGTVNTGFGEPPFTPRPVRVPRPERHWADRPLGNVDLDQYVLDLRADAPAPVHAWLRRPTRVRVVGPVFDPENAKDYYMGGGSLGRWFDVIVHRQEVTPWRPLAG